MSRSANIIKLKKRRYFLIVLLLFFIYMVVSFVSIFNKKTISSYQVKEGSLAIINIYTGIAIRQEQVYTSVDAGYIDYFAREGEHVSTGDLIYTVDESGVMDDLISNGSNGENALSDQDLSDLKTEVANFSSSFEASDYTSTYDFLYDVDGMILKLANQNVLSSLSELQNSSSLDLVKLRTAVDPGYIVYNTDGYEAISANAITPEMYDNPDYEKNQLINNSLIDTGDIVYKMITSEDWKLVIPLDETRAEELRDEGYVQIKFLSNQQLVWATIEILQNGENFYGVLGLNNSVVSFCTERFIDIELIGSNESGLKIPLSSIVYKEFYLIPKEYAIEEGEDNTYMFLRKTFLEDGTVSTEVMTIEVYAENEEFYYVDDSQLRIGDYLLTNDNASEFPVSTKGELVGVYNINKGYADFRQIVILYQNEEYAIVNSNTAYGLNVYDFIALDSSVINENDFVFE